jgi:hypothetical protein
MKLHWPEPFPRHAITFHQGLSVFERIFCKIVKELMVTHGPFCVSCAGPFQREPRRVPFWLRRTPLLTKLGLLTLKPVPRLQP